MTTAHGGTLPTSPCKGEVDRAAGGRGSHLTAHFRRGLSRPTDSSCPGLTRASMSLFSICQDVDGRDEPGHDDAERMLPRFLA